jgi:hypothetical protein
LGVVSADALGSLLIARFTMMWVLNSTLKLEGGWQFVLMSYRPFKIRAWA